jgi:hypothetical protein
LWSVAFCPTTLTAEGDSPPSRWREGRGDRWPPPSQTVSVAFHTKRHRAGKSVVLATVGTENLRDQRIAGFELDPLTRCLAFPVQHHAALLSMQKVIVAVWQVQRQAELAGERMLDL